MEIKQCMLTNNDCYKKGTKITPKGIIVHSTGANNPSLKRYVQPDDGLLGVNKNNNDWNRKGISKCVHAFIGKDKNGNVRVYQTLPFYIAAWGVGSGSKGSYNYNPYGHIQFEICEDGLTDEKYFNEAFDLAASFCAYLCKTYNLSTDTVISHKEAANKGYASNHNDCDNWLSKHNKNMNWFRTLVKSKMNSSYLVKITCNDPEGLNVRKGPGTNYAIVTQVHKGEVFTIVEEQGNWGKLKSGAGWIYLKNYTKKL